MKNEVALLIIYPLYVKTGHITLHITLYTTLHINHFTFPLHITITHYNTFDYTLLLQIIPVLNTTAHITITHYITDYHYITHYHYILPLYYTWHYTLHYYYIESSITYYITHYITIHNYSIVSDIDSTIFLPESILLLRGFKCVRMMTKLFCKRGFHTSTAFYSEQIGLY